MIKYCLFLIQYIIEYNTTIHNFNYHYQKKVSICIFILYFKLTNHNRIAFIYKTCIITKI